MRMWDGFLFFRLEFPGENFSADPYAERNEQLVFPCGELVYLWKETDMTQEQRAERAVNECHRRLFDVFFFVEQPATSSVAAIIIKRYARLRMFVSFSLPSGSGACTSRHRPTYTCCSRGQRQSRRCHPAAKRPQQPLHPVRQELLYKQRQNSCFILFRRQENLLLTGLPRNGDTIS